MARQSDPHYNDFGGLDTRTNKLTQNPKYARGGVNFRFNYRDELQKMNGFQKKIPAIGSQNGIFEYKFRDLNTGESRTEILGVSGTGTLNVLTTHYLKLTKVGGLVTGYTLFYDNLGTPSWKIQFLDVSDAVIGSISFPETDTLIDLKNDINTLALTGLTADVVDEDGVTVGSTTCLAYTLNTAINAVVSTGDTLNPAWFWTTVPFPDATTVPFPLVVSEAANPDYEGVTWVNENNAIYITDGGQLMKYDGFQVARAGMPKVFGRKTGFSSLENWSGFQVTLTTTGTTQWTDGYHNLRFQYCYADPNGVTILGEVQPNTLGLFQGGNTLENGPIVFVAVGSNTETQIYFPSIPQDHTFPVYGCRIDGAQTILGVPTPQTFTIDAGHNLQVGQALRVITYAISSIIDEVYYLEITGVTATTVTITGYPSAVPLALDDNEVYNSCYMPADMMGREQLDDQRGAIYGPYIRLLATKSYAGAVEDLSQPYYQFPVFWALPANTSQEYSKIIGANDPQLEIPFEEEDPEQAGAALPRAGRYISTWQNTLVQAGRTYDPGIADEYYPSIYDPTGVLTTFNNAIEAELLVTYTESALCDFQSIYWADSAVPEGFPQDGLHEFAIDTPFNDEMRGMAANKDSFFAFKARSTGYLTGSLAENNIQLEVMESDAGAACHKSIQDVEGALFYMDSNSGFWSVVAGRLPVFIGYGIQTYFKENNLDLNFRKAWAANFRFQDQYLCFIPGSNGSVTFVYDYASTATGARSAWYPWQGVDGQAGVLATSNDELLFSSKDTPTVWLQKFTGTKYDYSIHTSPVEFQYLGSWINFGKPTIDKRFVKVWMNSIQGGFDLLITQYANYLSPLIGDMLITFPIETANKLTVKNWMDVNVDKLSAISIGFENEVIYEDVRLQGWEIEFDPGFDAQEARK